jgi:PAS domain S-box-containing protein
VGARNEGTGIGLALVKELIELHKGTVSVESVVDEGTTFTVRVPFGHAHLPQDRLDASRSQVSTATGAATYVSEALRWLPNSVVAEALEGDDERSPQEAPAGERSRVLLADDNADMRDYLCRLLATQYDCVAVADGEEALAATRRQRPDLILTDVMMPRLDGFGLLEKLRDDPALRTVPVIVLSARAGDEAKVEGLRKGAADYLVKPFSAREFRARIAANIELSRTRAQSARVMHEEAQILDLLNKVGTAVAAELDLERAVQVVTDAATELSGAAFGSFFYNVIDEKGEAYTLYTISGVPREAFAKFPMPRNTAVFGPTFAGEGIVRSDDITSDPRYGRNAPYRGMPEGHLPVRSYLAVPVKSRSGEVLGGLFFGHSEIGIFGERAERIVAAIAVQAGIAIDKARLYRAAQEEIARRERVEAELRESETRYRGALITGRIAAWETDMVTRTRIWTEEGMQLFGLDLPNGRGQVGGEADEFWRALHPDDKHMMAEFHRTADAQDSYPCEYRIVRPDGSMRWVSGRGRVAARGLDGKAQRVANIVVDITDRKKAEEHVDLLMREVSHRSKNLLAVVQAIAGQTVRSAGTLAEFESRFAQRLQGLAGSHDLLVKENWRGVPLVDLARQQLAFFTEAGSARLMLEGPDIVLAAAASQSIGLALHELATNAVKYGAWSVSTGRVTINWTVEREPGKPSHLQLRWLESGGPITTPPTQSGFGTIVIEQIVANSVNGEVLLEFDPRGLRWTLSMPLDNLVAFGEELERAKP